MSKDQMFAKVVLASKPTNGALPLVTMHLHYPDIIHGEVMTHRVFSRNARSMRAVPVQTMLKEVRENPFVPWHWGKNQRGMQASEECNEPIDCRYIPLELDVDRISREDAWRHSARVAASMAEAYAQAGYHKQVANRIIAPYTWKHTLISSTSWANFLHLRDHDDAEPHFHDLAGLVREALAGAEYQKLAPGEWHLPYITDEDRARAYARERVGEANAILQKLSVARSARISYAPFDGDASIERELERYNLLVGSHPLHASPAEHQAQVDKYAGDPMSNDFTGYANEHLSGNLGPGWIQYRKTLPGEFVADAA